MVIVIVFVTVVALWFLCSLVILVWLVRSYRLITLVKIKENIFCIVIVKYVWYWSRTIFIKYIFPISKKLIFTIPHEQIFLRAGCAMWKGEAGTAGCWKKKAGKLNIVSETFWHAPITHYPRPLARFAGFKEAAQCSGNHIINQNYVSISRLKVKTKRPKKEARFRLNSSDLRSEKLLGWPNNLGQVLPKGKVKS